MIKRNNEPKNVDHVKKMKRKYPALKGVKWLTCIVCGDLCPQSNEEPWAGLDQVHVTCRYEPNYPALAKKLLKQKAEEARTSLF